MSSPTGPAPATQATPPPPPQSNVPIFGSAVVAGLVAIGGLLLTIYTEKPGAVVPWALCVLGLSAFAPIAPRVPRWAQVCVTAVIAIALISSSIVVFANPRLLTHTVTTTVRKVVPGPVQTPSPPQAPSIVLTHPADGDTSPVAGCFTMTWQGDPPSGWAYAVGSRASGEDLTYYEGQVQKTPSGGWAVTTTLGDEGKGMGQTYQIAIIMMPKDLHDYLESAQGDDKVTWWAGSGDPPGTVPVKHLSATRNNNAALGGNC